MQGGESLDVSDLRSFHGIALEKFNVHAGSSELLAFSEKTTDMNSLFGREQGGTYSGVHVWCRALALHLV